MRVSRASLDALEFASLRRVAAQFAANDLGRIQLLSSMPVETARELRRSLATTVRVERLLEDGPLVVNFEEDLAPLAEEVAREHSGLAGGDLVLLASVLTSSQAALARIATLEPPDALLEAVAHVPDLTELATRIVGTLDERGRVRDNASPLLGRLSKKSRRVRRGLYARLGNFVSGHRDNLAEETVSVQDGRLVLLLRSGSKGRLPGVVQGRSSTGRSFYFEPLEFVEENNELQASQREEEAERQRVLTELMGRVRSHAGPIREHWRLLADLDARQALCRLKKHFGGHFIEPEDGGEMELVDARHPLLDPCLADQRERALGQAGHLGKVVPLSLALNADQRMLIVTGPNAGGKTVALKTTGLLTLAAHCGFPLPVGLHSRIPFLTALVAVVGDDQDLLEERSTFSGKLLRLHEVWREAHDRSLVLVDELGSGTDPTEGAALGVALVEALSEKKPWTVITTHLTSIAASALDLDGAGCAAMEFDAGQGAPTYRLVPGAPGGSEALALARRLDLPAEWLDRAEQLLGPEERRLRRLLQEVETSKRKLEDERVHLAEQLATADRDSREAAAQLDAASRERALLTKRLKRELRDFQDEVRGKLRAETERLALEVRSGGHKRTAAGRAVERLFDQAPEWSSSSASNAMSLEIGAAVEHTELGWSGELSKLDGERATVSVRGKRVQCAVSELALVEPGHGGKAEIAPTSASNRGPDESSGGVAELILIGVRVEPALENLENFLDRALLSSNESVRIVHGHGTGRLRAAIRERLEGHRAISSWRPGGDSEGGDGATVAVLAG